MTKGFISYKAHLDQPAQETAICNEGLPLRQVPEQKNS